MFRHSCRKYKTTGAPTCKSFWNARWPPQVSMACGHSNGDAPLSCPRPGRLAALGAPDFQGATKGSPSSMARRAQGPSSDTAAENIRRGRRQRELLECTLAAPGVDGVRPFGDRVECPRSRRLAALGGRQISKD